MNNLMDKAHSFCESLEELGVEYYRNPYLNIISMRSKYISSELAKEFFLVPDTHDSSVEWYKIVLMPHVKPGVLDTFFIQRLCSIHPKEIIMSLIAKYNVPVPRYTSYPTVPFWDNQLNLEQWENLVKQSFQLYNQSEGISLYIHLPYCESLCTYCACNTRITVNHGVEEPYINAVLQEWKMYVALFNEKPRIKEIHLGGGTPTFFSAKIIST